MIEWRPLPGYEASHEISSDGYIRRFITAANGKHPKTLARWVSSRTGYLMVTLWRDKIRQNVSLHRMMLRAFLGEPPSHKPWALHCDGDKMNLSLDNLYWGTSKENQADSRRHGTKSLGEAQPLAKLNAGTVREIRAACAAGLDQRATAVRFGIHQATVHRVHARKSWAHIA